ncbi:hypothetical protein MJO28_016183 [Puccinia striiformis f. sp. tritici]|uniref:Uncharacterized protein n=1 Tax=Puccinia striiformis f. sp. tritici TaxID=168172 RepID=A0ACC0DMR6_9BASI|nr:hypothetical protein MJO28_016183 [Puccinia striiformis f. sp. tritici]
MPDGGVGVAMKLQATLCTAGHRAGDRKLVSSQNSFKDMLPMRVLSTRFEPAIEVEKEATVSDGVSIIGSRAHPIGFT